MPLIKDGKGRQVVPIVIGGKNQPIDEDRVLPVKNSKTDEDIHYFQSAKVDICSDICEAAWNSFQSWKKASVDTRRNILLKAADIYMQRRQELVELQKAETSCDDFWAGNNVEYAATGIREIASCISQIKGEIPPIAKPNTHAFVYKDPIGPVLVIPPWNAALILANRAITTAIAAGCTVVLKASELSPATHAAIYDIYKEAGLPDGVLNVLQAARSDAPAVTEALIANPRIRKIEFIGSAAVGRIIGATAAKHLKPVLMELGGKCPAIVLDDCDVQKAATLCAKGALLHHGQICFSTERIIVQRGVAEKFQEALIKVAEATTGGTAVTEGIAQHALDVLQDAKDKGLKFLMGGPEFAGKNAVHPALVSVDAKIAPDKIRIVDEETFGPSASVYIVDTDEEAIALANRSSYGLNATIHTKSLERGINMGRELEYGQVHINSTTIFTSATGPQGGRTGKTSGWGRQNAMYGLSEYLDDKFITFHTD